VVESQKAELQKAESQEAESQKAESQEAELPLAGLQEAELQQALIAGGFLVGSAGGNFGSATRDAVAAFQRSAGLAADGIVGPRTAAALGLRIPQSPPPPPSRIPAVTVDLALQIVPAPRVNVESNLPFVLNALVAPQLADKSMILMALATIRAETGSFLPISEGHSRFNTSPGGPPFDLYDHRTNLGNQGPPDGERFKGRGFIQLTGRANYTFHGNAIGLGHRLIENPDLANRPDIAARLLAGFLKKSERKIREALTANDLKEARRLVNGGTHGLQAFTDAYNTGLPIIPDEIAVVSATADS
jgi:peptidoglycan L-alanyl-D-glutamate endopeptidase CwlK